MRTNEFVGQERSDLSFRLLQALENGLTSGSVCSYNNDRHGTKLTGRREFPSLEPVGYKPTTGIVLIQDRNANAALYRVMLTRMSSHEETRVYVARRRAESRSTAEVIRCLKRYVARQVFKHLPQAA